MKSYKVTREIQKENVHPASAADMYITTEKGTLKEFQTKGDAHKYLADLRKKAFQNRKFVKVTNNGKNQFRAYTADGVYIYSVK